MADTEIREIGRSSRTLTKCPVFLIGDDGPIECNEPLEVVYDYVVIGDDYGSWVEHDVYFRCGHSLEDIKVSLRHAGEI